MISSILEEITKLSIDLYFDALSIVKNSADDTLRQMTSLPPNSCTEDAIGRWNRQVNAYNYQLTYCLRESKRILQGEYDDLNYFDKDGARVSNHVPNQSFNMMLQHDVVQEGPGFYKIVNNRLRDLLLRAGRKFFQAIILSTFIYTPFSISVGGNYGRAFGIDGTSQGTGYFWCYNVYTNNDSAIFDFGRICT